MVLTPLAEDLVGPVRTILLQVRETLGTKPRFDAATATRHFSIAVSDYATAVLMTDVLRQARCDAPYITFELRSVGQRANEDLERGELDFLIAPEGYVSASHPSDVLFEDTFTCIAWSGNDAVGATLSLNEYLNLRHVVVKVGTTSEPSYDEQVLRRFNYKRRVELSVPSFSLAPQLVVETDRVATIQTRLALKYAEILPLKLVPLPIDIPPMVEMLQWHKAHDHDPAQHWFRELLKASVTKLPPACSAAAGTNLARCRAKEAPTSSRARGRPRGRGTG
jgi:DNA-binding transcriptional LysR family regulator